MPFKQIKPQELSLNLFQAIGSDWMLVSAEKEGRVNTMTASWGGAGILWGKPVVYVFIRPQRFTREFVDHAATLSLSFYPEQYREQLTICGSKSGRDIDKVEACGFTVARENGAPYFEQAHTVIIARKLYRQQLDPASFLVDGLDGHHYPGKDYHYLYVAEVEQVLQQQ